MSVRAERSTRARDGGGGDEVKKKRPPLRKVLPEIWTLIKPRRWLLAFGFVLMVINRVSGLVLPASTKFLVDGVLVKRQAEKLPWIVGAVLLATTIQAITSFSLTQLLSKAAQRLIADQRPDVEVRRFVHAVFSNVFIYRGVGARDPVRAQCNAGSARGRAHVSGTARVEAINHCAMAL